MDDNITRSENSRPLPGIERKPLDNPQRHKPVSAAELERARSLDVLFHRLPEFDAVASAHAFPLLTTLDSVDAGLARALVLLAAQVHVDADERRTAEYLLRRRHQVTHGGRPAVGLLRAAHAAAEMDLRRARLREPPLLAEPVAAPAVPGRPDEPSVGEVVTAFLYRATGHRPATRLAYSRLLDAVAIAMEVAERHNYNNGTQPSLLAMRSGARIESRLSTHLRAEFDDAIAGRSLARLLVGGDNTPITSALLWWAGHPTADPAGITQSVRNRWVRDLADADPAVRGSSAKRRRLVQCPAGA